MSITTTEASKDFHVKPVEKCLGNPEHLFGWPSGERFLIQQTHEAGAAYYSREDIQTIVEAMQAWLDEHAPKAFEAGDRVQLNAHRALWANGDESGTQPGRGALGTIEDGVDEDGDIWVCWDVLGPGAVDPALLLPAAEEPMPEKVDAYSDEEREANGKLVFVGESGSDAWISAAGGRVQHREIGGAWPYWHGFWEVSGFDPDDFKPIEPTLLFGDSVIKAGDKVKIRTTKVGGDPRWTKVSESDWLEVKVNTRNELHADGRILAHANVTILEHYPAAEREANGRRVFAHAGQLDFFSLGVTAVLGRIGADDPDLWEVTGADPADFHPVFEPEPLKVGDRVRLVNLKEPYWTCHGIDEFTGRTGVVLEVLNDGHWGTRVAVDGDGLPSRGLAFSELERV